MMPTPQFIPSLTSRLEPGFGYALGHDFIRGLTAREESIR